MTVSLFINQKEYYVEITLKDISFGVNHYKNHVVVYGSLRVYNFLQWL